MALGQLIGTAIKGAAMTNPLGLAATAIPTLFNLGRSIFGGAQLARNKRPVAPTYEIPTAVQDYIRRRNILAQQDLPGRDIIESQIGSQVAGAIGDVNRSASSSSAALGAVTGMNQRAVDAIRDLGVRAAEYRAQQQNMAAESQKYLADYQEKAWEYNKNLPYQRSMNEYMANKQAGAANLWGGLEGIGSSVLQGLSGMQRDKQWQSLIDAIKGGGSMGGTAAATPVDRFRGLMAPNLMQYPSNAAWQLSRKIGK